jgi:lysophospholipase
LSAARAALNTSGAGAPLFVVAHSFGALTTLKYCIEGHQKGLAGLMLSAPYLKTKVAVPALKLLAGELMSGIWPSLAMPMGLKGTMASHDPEQQREFDTDPLSNKKATTRWFTEALAGQAAVLARAGEITLPCLVMHGAADPIADPAQTEEVFARLTSTDKTLEMLKGQLHEIFMETRPDRDRTIERVVAWLSDRAARAMAAGDAPRVA